MPSALSAASATERRSFSRPRPIAAIDSSSTTLASRTALSGSSTNADWTPNQRSRMLAAYSGSSSACMSGRAGDAGAGPEFSSERVPPLAGRLAGTRPAGLLVGLLVADVLVPLIGAATLEPVLLPDGLAGLVGAIEPDDPGPVELGSTELDPVEPNPVEPGEPGADGLAGDGPAPGIRRCSGIEGTDGAGGLEGLVGRAVSPVRSPVS